MKRPQFAIPDYDHQGSSTLSKNFKWLQSRIAELEQRVAVIEEMQLEFNKAGPIGRFVRTL